jgi:uncharacterized membrane protein YjdF
MITRSQSHMPPWPLIVFTLAYLVVAVAGAFASGNKEFLIYITVMVVLIATVLWVDRRVDLSYGLLWCLSVWGLLHMAGGLLPVPESWPIDGDNRVLYSWWLVPGILKYDQVVHAYGFACATWASWQCLQMGIATRAGVDRSQVKPALGFMVLCAVAGMGFGALNEVIEFTATLTVPETNVGGYVNTGWDLVSNMVGSSTAAVFIWVFGK